tara:strand:- start:923 stop:1981 length:1059 start_codon:yes stop_codon:yes gene_type:complete
LKIFVTGGAGFIGCNFIIKQLSETDNKILNFDKLTYAGNLESLRHVESNNNYSFVKGDICDRAIVQDALEKFQPDAIVNFAAESHVDRSIDAPFNFIDTNIVGTAILLDESLNYYKHIKGIKKNNFKFLHISTDEVYGSLGENDFFSETTAYDPSSPYSASKASSDHLVKAWHRTYELPVVITNCSNNYGPYQFPEKLIPLVILNCISGLDLPIYGKGDNIRDWLHVADHCDAIYKVLISGKLGNTYNIGGNNEIKNIDIVNIICAKMNEILPRSNNQKYEELITFVKDRPGHDFRYAIDSTKICEELSWYPKESFETGIEKTINWYLNNKLWWESIKDKKYNQERLGVFGA